MTMPCKVVGCFDDARTRGMCSMHYQRAWKHGNPLARRSAANGEGHINHVGHKVVSIDGRRAAEHVLVCERAYGGRLPRGVQVFHVDGDAENNAPGNLVICGTHAYHALLSVRSRAYDATGNPDARQCGYCRQWDEAANLSFRKGQNTGFHRRCRQASRKSPLAVVLSSLMKPTTAGFRERWIW